MMHRRHMKVDDDQIEKLDERLGKIETRLIKVCTILDTLSRKIESWDKFMQPDPRFEKIAEELDELKKMKNEK